MLFLCLQIGTVWKSAERDWLSDVNGDTKKNERET